MLKILISAAEASSDAHGAQLLRALKAQAIEAGAESVEAFGIGGPELQREGLRAVFDARELLAMGFQEILGRLPRIFRALSALTDIAARERPDIAVVIDYPDFHFRLAKRLKALGVPVIYYIPPKVWAWRKGRLGTLRKLFVRVLSILPFEESFYRGEGVPVKYVGNPLADELPLDLRKEEARSSLGLGVTDKVLLAMPGSRPAELERHTQLMLEAASLTAAELKKQGVLGAGECLRVLLPLPRTASLAETQCRVKEWMERGLGDSVEVRVSHGDSHSCMVAADVGMIKSGTSTLEAGLLGCPHSIVYKPSRLTSWIFRYLIRYRGAVGLVNLVAGGLKQAKDSFLLKEILLDEATPGKLAEETVSLFVDPARRARINKGLEALKAGILGRDSGNKPWLGPSHVAAAEILSIVKTLRSKGS